MAVSPMNLPAWQPPWCTVLTQQFGAGVDEGTGRECGGWPVEKQSLFTNELPVQGLIGMKRNELSSFSSDIIQVKM